MNKQTILIVMILGLLSGAAFANPSEEELAAFQQLLQKVQTDPGTSSEAEVQKLLSDAEKYGRAYTASLAVRAYLTQNFNPSPSLMLAAARNAASSADPRTAVSRYKVYLENANGDREASLAAAHLLHLSINVLRQEDDAFQYMTQLGSRFREAPESRQFDHWYINQARNRSEFAGMANRLSIILKEKLPIELEQRLYWDDIEWLMYTVTHGQDAHIAALPGIRELLKSYRGDAKTKAKYELFAEYLGFLADGRGRDDSTADRRFESVRRAAVNFVKTDPTAKSVETVVSLFAGGFYWGRDGLEDRWEEKIYLEQAGQAKAATFADIFDQLNDAERRRVLTGQIRGQSRVEHYGDWAGIALKHPNVFKDNQAAGAVGFDYRRMDAEQMRRLAPVVKNIPTVSAAYVDSLAQGKDFAKVARRFVREHAWYLNPEHFEWYGDRALWPEFDRIYFEGKGSHDLRNVGFAALGEEMSSTIAAHFSPKMVRSAINSKFNALPVHDRAEIIEMLDALQWVPWNERDRRDALNDAVNNFRRWSSSVRRDLSKKENNVTEKTIAQISEIDAAFKRLLEGKGDPAKAPNELTREFTRLILAEQAQDSKTWNEAAKKLYEQVKRYDEKPVAFGSYLFEYILRERRGIDNIDFHLDVVRDQLAQWKPNADDQRIRRALELTYKGRSNWDYYRTRRENSEDSMKFAAVYAEALKNQIAAGEFWPDLFYWLRGARKGNGWNESNSFQDVAELIIEKRVFDKHDYSMVSDSPVVGYMAMIRWDFPGLEEKYPRETYFDDWFIAESKSRQYLEWRYWEFGRDAEGKVANAAAEILASFDRIPLGYAGEKHPFTEDNYWNWVNRAMNAEASIRNKMLDQAAAAYGKGRWDELALGRHWFSYQADVSSADGRQAYFDRLRRYITEARKIPTRISIPSMRELSKLDPKSISEAELDTLLSIFPYASTSYWSRDHYYETLALTIQQAAIAQKRVSDLYVANPDLWRIVLDTRNTSFGGEMSDTVNLMMDEGDYDVAVASATYGMDVYTLDLSSDARSTLTAVKSRGLSNVGGFIPVPRSDPRYPIFAAQAAYLTDRLETAWEQYVPNKARVLTMYQDLDPGFVIWLIQKNTETRNFDDAEKLARELIVWVERASDTFETETRAQLELAYGDIARARREYGRARALYSRIADNATFENTRAKIDAVLRVIDVDRETRQYDAALDAVENLLRRRDPYVRTQALYAKAQIEFAQENYSAAREALDELFIIAPNQPLATVLLGRVNLQLRRIEQATEVNVSPAMDRKFIVPGKVLRVELEDRNLSIVGRATELPIRVWTTSGDEEVFNLYPFGDSKTHFRGETPTALGEIRKNDRVVQLRGDDAVHYDFTEAFKKENNITQSVTHTLTVTSDSELMISSGEILTAAERERLAMETMIRRQVGLQQRETEEVALNTVRPSNQVKPGNPINIRVIDPDQSKSDKRDTLNVRVVADSGDVVSTFPLQETGESTGVFEGALLTDSGIATAYASDSQDGSDPNFVISSKSYPAWVGLADNRRPKTFSVDLKDNLELANMQIKAGVPGRQLLSFLVQTSLNGSDFTTVGSWPEAYKPWDGSPQVRIAVKPDDRAPRTLKEFRQFIDHDQHSTGLAMATVPIETIAAKWGTSPADQAREIGLSNRGSNTRYVAHFRAAFVQTERKVRTFDLEVDSKSNVTRWMLVVNGEPGETDTTVRRSLLPGVHTVEVFLFTESEGRPEVKLMTDRDSPEPPFMQEAPASMFSITRNPRIRQEIYKLPATVVANDAKNNFSIRFPEGVSSRVVRLLLLDFETDAPAIEKISLAARDGTKVLPTEQDFMELRQNQVLEIIPGDRIRVTYEDPKFISQGARLREASLTATYTNGRISATFVRWEVDRNGSRTARYVPMQRFQPGDALKVFVFDPDMDISSEPDVAEFTARTTSGKQIVVKALETGPHTGVFLGDVFPVMQAKGQTNELLITKDENITLSYMDRENTDPGIPWIRTVEVDQAFYVDPELRIYNVTSQPLPEQAIAELKRRRAEAIAAGTATADQAVPPTRELLAQWPIDPESKSNTLVTGPLIVELLWPSVAFAPDSEVKIYAQSARARAQAGVTEGFDLSVPGTVEFDVRPGNPGAGPAPVGYHRVTVRGNPQALSPLADGRFGLRIPLELGTIPPTTLVKEAGAPDMSLTLDEEQALAVQGDDSVFVGFRYQDDQGREQWIVREVSLFGDAFFDVMDRQFSKPITGAYVGESVYLRVIDRTRDTSADRDTVTVKVTTESGQSRDIELMETFSHSGEFQGIVRLNHVDESTREVVGVLPVIYGDQVSLTYARPDSEQRVSHQFIVHKGSDAQVVPFTKRFEDPAIAVQTQFMLAEAYFEQAKQHRTLARESAEAGNTSQANDLTALSRREMDQGRRLLFEAIRDHPDTDARVQAEYLLGNLDLEYGNEAVNVEVRNKRYADALSRFTDIVSSYPNSPYAPQAQYKRALVYEKMGEIDKASEEYVKLSYRYPDNELVAETIARLGQYFLVKGREMREAMDAAEDPVEAERIRMQSVEMFTTAAEVFSRLGARFPQHELAGKTAVLSAQCYMQAGNNRQAAKQFDLVVEDQELPPELKAEAMYWSGENYLRMAESGVKVFGEDQTPPMVLAYRRFKKLDWDYPTTIWARYARGRLADTAALAEIDQRGGS